MEMCSPLHGVLWQLLHQGLLLDNVPQLHLERSIREHVKALTPAPTLLAVSGHYTNKFCFKMSRSFTLADRGQRVHNHGKLTQKSNKIRRIYYFTPFLYRTKIINS